MTKSCVANHVNVVRWAVKVALRDPSAIDRPRALRFQLCFLLRESCQNHEMKCKQGLLGHVSRARRSGAICDGMYADFEAEEAGQSPP